MLFAFLSLPLYLSCIHTPAHTHTHKHTNDGPFDLVANRTKSSPVKGYQYRAFTNIFLKIIFYSFIHKTPLGSDVDSLESKLTGFLACFGIAKVIRSQKKDLRNKFKNVNKSIGCERLKLRNERWFPQKSIFLCESFCNASYQEKWWAQQTKLHSSVIWNIYLLWCPTSKRQ